MPNTASPTTINTRINALTEQFMSENHTHVAASLQPALRSITEQAFASAEGGKRLRALLLLQAADSAGLTHTGAMSPLPSKKPEANGTTEHSIAVQDSCGTADKGDTGANADANPTLDLACAVEIYQTSALIHDDIIDDSPLRRGKPSAHRALGLAAGDTESGMGLALMLGNMLSTLSARIAADAAHTMHKSTITDIFLDMQRAVEIGQVLDQAAQRSDLSSPETLVQSALNVYAWKTASYTTIAPLRLGLLCAGMDDDTAQRAAQSIGLPLGLAFQLYDDLIDITGESATTGKPVGGDVIEGKRTVLVADALNAARNAQHDRLLSMYRAQTRTDADRQDALDIFEDTGAIASSRQRIARYIQQSDDAIQTLELPQSARQSLTDICHRFCPITD